LKFFKLIVHSLFVGKEPKEVKELKRKLESLQHSHERLERSSAKTYGNY